MTAALIILVISGTGCGLVLVIYPVFVWLAGLRHAQPQPPLLGAEDAWPRVSVVVAFAGSGSLLKSKLANLQAVDYPADRLELVLASDGPMDTSLEPIIKEAGEVLPIRCVDLETPRGKAYALNQAAPLASGDVLVFSDLDAQLEPGSIKAMVRWFTLEDVGGICGKRVLSKRGGAMRHGQSRYVGWNSRLKQWENRLGAITANDGKLYAIRRSLFRPIHPTATDDLYSGISVVLSGYRFLFEPEARAVIPPPAWSIPHDFHRRRRIVVRSLSGLLARPSALLATRFTLFGPRLVVNKVLRRALPVFFIGLLVGSAMLARESMVGMTLLAIQGIIYAAAALYPFMNQWFIGLRVHRLWQVLFYATLGMVSMFVGVVEFLCGRRIAQWQPRKTG